MTEGGYRVRLTRQADKDLVRLRGMKDRAVKALLKLEDNPFAGHTLTGSLRGARSLESSLPGGAYRAAYIVHEAKRICLVFTSGPHEGFYERAGRRMRSL